MLPYLPPATAQCPNFTENTEWQPIVDGADYFRELDRQLSALARGDGLLVTGMSLDPDLDLCGRAPGEAGYAPLGARLGRLAADGVLVRVLIAGRVLASSAPTKIFGSFHGNVGVVRRLRDWRPPGADPTGSPPLADRVLLDFSGATLGSNHQKVVAVRHGDEVTAFVAGIDLDDHRLDAAPHDSLRLRGERWGWHDAAVRLRGPAAAWVWDLQRRRWTEAATQRPARYLRHGRLQRLNPPDPAPAASPAPIQAGRSAPATDVRVLQSVYRRKYDSLRPWRRQPWDTFPADGVHDVHATLVSAIGAATRYVYVEDQYLAESVGGVARYELFPHLRAAARRGVRVILVGSGTRDPDDPGFYLGRINRTVNRDIRRSVLEPLGDTAGAAGAADTVAVLRVEHLTVHSKIFLIDDAFANIGSANIFSRSMAGVDQELTTAISTTTSLVRDLRVRLWAEHLRTPLTDQVRVSLEDLDLALGIWDARWLPSGVDPRTWRTAGLPAGFTPVESVLQRVPR